MERSYHAGSHLREPGRPDEWELVQTLGRGESGVVYRAIRVDGLENAEESAIKVIVSFINDSGDLKQLADKERRAARIEAVLEKVKDVPHIVKYEDFFRVPFVDDHPEKGFYLIIRMESLTPIDTKKSMGEKDAAKLGLDICSALEACEKLEIIHRDIKLSNILVAENGDYKLGDFGVAHIPTEGRTRTALAGTFDYMAPEVFHQEKFDFTVDTYSLGMTLYRILKNENFSKEFTSNRLKGDALPPLENVDYPLRRIIQKACEYDPAKRYLNASAMKKDLQSYLAYLDGALKLEDLELPAIPLFPPSPEAPSKPQLSPSPESQPLLSQPSPHPESQPLLSQPSPSRKRRAIVIAAITMIALLIATGCWFAFSRWSHIIDVTEIRLNSLFLEMTIEDEPFQLSATVLPENATNQTVTWSSDNPEAASVNNGLVMANGTGTAIITAESGDCTAICKVTVSPPPDSEIPPQEVILNLSSLEMTVGDEPFQLNATVLPENATNRTVTWSSNASSVASVSNGLVTANGEGNATITAKSGDCTATCAVTVSPKPPEVIEVKEVRVNPTSLGMTVGEEKPLSAMVLPENATNQTVTWNSSNSDIVSVSGGLVTAHRQGTATITAKCGSCTATCTVKVIPKNIEVTGVQVNPTSYEMTVGEEKRLSVTVLPENATNRTVTWSSDKTSVASVSDGLVKAQGKGEAVITAKSGSCTATCTVKVIPENIEVTGVQVNPTSHEMTVGEEKRLSVTVLPENATNRTVTWSSSDSSVVSISDGLVKAQGKGEAVITVKSGSCTATCTVKVLPKNIKVTGVQVNPTSHKMNVGEEKRLSVTVLPENATNRTVTWSSSNPAVVTVNQEGGVTAIDKGEATVAASCGGMSASCKISVIIPTVPVERVSIANISDNWLEINRGQTRTLTANVYPSNATDSKITWNSDNPSVASISADGVLTGVGKGRAVITASAGGQSDSFTVAVIAPVTGVTLNSNSLSIANGESRILIATVTPSDANDATVTWTTTNSSVARVSNGTVTGTGDGTATIIAQAGEIKAHCTVQVTTRWSAWSDEYPNVSVPKEQRTVYQYIEKRKETTTSSSPSLDGYTRTDSTTEIGEPSAWTDSVIYPSDSLQVETQQVTDVEGHTEYRYGRWQGAVSNNWCKEYGEALHGGTYTEQYTNWSTTRAYCDESPNNLWLCGSTDSQHPSHSLHPAYRLDSRGYPGWRKYLVNDQGFSDPEFFWEETRWVDTTYKTQYRSRPVSVIYSYERWVEDSRSDWTTEWREVDNITCERQEKIQYRYMVT